MNAHVFGNTSLLDIDNNQPLLCTKTEMPGDFRGDLLDRHPKRLTGLLGGCKLRFVGPFRDGDRNHLLLTIANDLHLDRLADPECRDHHQQIMRVLDLFAVDFDHDIA